MSSQHGGRSCLENNVKVIGFVFHIDVFVIIVSKGIRNFIVNFILQSSSSEESLKSQRTFLNKLNLVLVSVLKQEWPHNWPTFINEIIASCHTSLSICENNMAILRLLSEEVFDFSADQMTSAKTKNLKNTMSAEFAAIFQLCSEVLNTANQSSLIKATLETLLRFLNWIPLGYIFETPIIDTLRTRFLETVEFRNITLKCLTEISSVQIGPQYGNQYDEKLVQMFTEVIAAVTKIISLSISLKTTYPTSDPRDQEFVLNLALFLCNFFTVHLNVRQLIRNVKWIVLIFLAYRESSESGLSASLTLLFSAHLANRGPRNFQDLLGILDQACTGIVRRDATIAYY